MIEAYDTLLERDDELLKNALIRREAEERKYRQGRSDLFFVIQARDSVLAYELTRITDYVQLKTLEVQLLALQDGIRMR